MSSDRGICDVPGEFDSIVLSDSGSIGSTSSTPSPTITSHNTDDIGRVTPAPILPTNTFDEDQKYTIHPAAASSAALNFPISVPRPDFPQQFDAPDINATTQNIWQQTSETSLALDRSTGLFVLPPTARSSPLDHPEDVLMSIVRRTQPARSPSAFPPLRSPISVYGTHPLSQTTSSARTSRLDQSHTRSIDRSAARESQRTRLESDQIWSETLARIRTEHEEAIKAKDKQHTFEQVDLLTAFQNDRSETERKNQLLINALRDELEHTAQNLLAHQELYTQYSSRIQSELHQLRDEVTQAQHTIHEQDQRAAEQQQVIQKLQHDAVVQQQEQQRQAEAQQQERIAWERQLVQQSNDILRTKQEAFDRERDEREAVMHTLTQQLESITHEKATIEIRLKKVEERDAGQSEKIHLLETRAREMEGILKAQRELNTEVTQSHAALEKLYQSTQQESQSYSKGLQRTEAEYQQMEELYNELQERSGEKIRVSQLESNGLRDLCEQARRTIDKLASDLKKSQLDRSALQHTFLRLKSQAKLRKLLAHWICIAQAKKWRNREVGFFLEEKQRREKREALRRWKQQVIVMGLKQKHQETLSATQLHCAAQFQQHRLQQSKARAFQSWIQTVKESNKRRERKEVEQKQQQDLASSIGKAMASDPNTLASLVEIERNKKIELFHLLQRERSVWSEQKQLLESQVRNCELARSQEQAGLASLHQILDRIRGEHNQLQMEVQRKVELDSAVQRAIHDTLLHEQSQHLDSLTSTKYPWHQPVVVAPIVPSAQPPANLAQHKQDLRNMLQTQQPYTELASLQKSTSSEQSRLAAIKQLREEREAFELAQAQLGSAHVLQPLTSGIYPSFGGSSISRGVLADSVASLGSSTIHTVSSATKKRRSHSTGSNSKPRSIIKQKEPSANERIRARKAVQFQREGH